MTSTNPSNASADGAPATPGEHAAATGHARLARDIGGAVVGVHDAEHLAAQGLHGWKLHEHHANAPILLSREDYLAAVEAAKDLVLCRDERHHYVPHLPALSPHSPLAGKGACPEPKPAEVDAKAQRPASKKLATAKE